MIVTAGMLGRKSYELGGTKLPRSLSDGALLGMVFQQDARPAQEACESQATVEPRCGAVASAAWKSSSIARPNHGAFRRVRGES